MLWFVHEQQFALQEDWNEKVMYQQLCHVAMEHDKPVERNTKSELPTKKANFGKKFFFEFKVSLVEEIRPSDSIVWSHWTENGSSGMEAVAQAQLSNGHHKRPKKRTWKVERNSNLLKGLEGIQLNENGLQDDTTLLHD